MAKRTERRENLATEIISMVKRKLWRCRVALIISLAGNVIQAAVLIFRQEIPCIQLTDSSLKIRRLFLSRWQGKRLMSI